MDTQKPVSSQISLEQTDKTEFQTVLQIITV